MLIRGSYPESEDSQKSVAVSELVNIYNVQTKGLQSMVEPAFKAEDYTSCSIRGIAIF